MKLFKKIIIGALVVLGIFFIIVMILPDDEPEPSSGKDRPEAVVTTSANSAVTSVSNSVPTTSETSKPVHTDPSAVRPVNVGSEARSATIMVYVNGSDLESKYGEASGDIGEMIASGIGNNVNVIIQTMGTRKWQEYGISAKTSQTFQVKNGRLNILRDDLGQLDCTSADTLSEFIGFCKKNYPADRYIMLFWDHGGGPVYGFGYDEWQNEDASLTIAEMAQAFSNHQDIHFDMIGMDCCIMASVETCYVLAPFCKYALLSEDFESGLGWSYTNWMRALEENPGLSTTLLGKYIVDDVIKDNETDYNGDSACLSLFNVATANSLFEAWKAYAYKNEAALLKKNYSKEHRAKKRSSRGFFDFWNDDDSDVTLADYYISDILAMVENIDNDSEEAKNLVSTLKAAVAYYGHTSDKNELTGMAVSLPYGDSYFYEQLRSVYRDIGLDQEYINWLGGFVNTTGGNEYYDYDPFSSNWSGWGSYEQEYGCNSSNGTCEYGWNYGSEENHGGGWYDWYDWDDPGYGGGYGSEYDDESDYCDDWIYDYELELWYIYDDGILYLYDDETDTTYYYDEDEDEIYYYDEEDDEWYLCED